MTSLKKHRKTTSIKRSLMKKKKRELPKTKIKPKSKTTTKSKTKTTFQTVLMYCIPIQIQSQFEEK